MATSRLFILSSYFLPLIFADGTQMELLLTQMLNNHTQRSLGRRLVIRDRQFSGNTHNAITQLNEYGCWCYFYDDVGRGKGTPVDEIDSMCKILANCYECAIRDTENEGDICVPWDVSFNPGINGAGLSLFEGCKANNPDDNCAQRACTCEGFFVENLFALLLTGNAFSSMDEFSHKSGFDPSTKKLKFILKASYFYLLFFLAKRFFVLIKDVLSKQVLKV